MLYQDLVLPTFPDRPYVYTNFVQTVDGKTWVTKDSGQYWPIGSEQDYQVLTTLRSQADVLIHGSGSATLLRHLDKLGTDEFQSARQKKGKTKPLLYVLVSAHPGLELLHFLENAPKGTKSLLATTQNASIPAQIAQACQVIQLGEDLVDVTLLRDYLHKEGYKQLLVEGGPHLLSSFLAKNLIDELFLTIAPKIFGNQPDGTYTLSEGVLFSPEEVKALTLLSAETVENELYLRYRFNQS